MLSRLTSNNKTQKEQNLLIKSTITLIHSYKLYQDHLYIEAADV